MWVWTFVEWYWQRRAKVGYSERNLSQYHFVHQSANLECNEVENSLHVERLTTTIRPISFSCDAVWVVRGQHFRETCCLFLQSRKFLPSTLRHVLPQCRCRIIVTKCLASYPCMVILIPSWYFVNQFAQLGTIGYGTKSANACSINVTFLDRFKPSVTWTTRTPSVEPWKDLWLMSWKEFEWKRSWPTQGISLVLALNC